MSDRENSLLISVEEARRELGGISRGVIYQLVHSVDFPTVKIGRRLLISRPGLQAWITKRTGTFARAAGNGDDDHIG